MKKDTEMFILFMIVMTLIFGWCLNIFKIIGMDGFSGLMVLRVIGIFVAPIGSIIGYI